MILIDKLAYSSELRDRSPFMKAGFSIGTLLLCVLSGSVGFSAVVMFIMGYSAVKYSRVSLYRYIKMMLMPAVFLILGSVAIIFDISEEPLNFIDIPVGSFFISATEENILYGLKLMMTATGSVSCLYFLSLTTPLQEIIILMKELKIPWLIIEITVLMYRFIFITGDMASAITTAQNCRLGNGSFRRKIEDMGTMLSCVFVRSFDKAGKMYDGMEARCYNGRMQVLWEYRKASVKEKILSAVYFALLIPVAFLLH